MIAYIINNKNVLDEEKFKFIVSIENIDIIEIEDLTLVTEEFKKFNMDDVTFDDYIYMSSLKKGELKGSEMNKDAKPKKMTKEQKERGLKLLKELKMVKLRKLYEVKMNLLYKEYNIERSTWDKQIMEAKAYKEDNNAEVPFIKQLAETRGVELDVLVNKIIKKADEFSIALGKMLGEQHKYEDLIKTIDSFEKSLEVNEKLPQECVLSVER